MAPASRKSSQQGATMASTAPMMGSRRVSMERQTSKTSIGSLEPVKLDRDQKIMSALAGVRPFSMAATLPAALPDVWSNPKLFKTNFDTNSMPIRLEIMKDWHRKTLGPCSEVYPDEMPATHWLAKGSLGRPNGKFPGWDKWPKEEDRKADALKKDTEDTKDTKDTKATKDARDTKDTTKKGGKDKGLRRGSTKAVETKSEDQPGGALPTKAELEAAAIKIQSAQRCRVARGIFADRKLALLFATNKGTGGIDPDSVFLPKIDSLPKEPDLQELDLRFDCVGRLGAGRLSQLMGQELDRLELHGNYIGSIGVGQLSSTLDKQEKLKVLGLAWNGIGDEGLAYLAKAVKQLQQLEELSLAHNRFGDVGAKALAEALKGHKSLTQLDLQDNAITQIGVEELLRAGGRRLKLNLSGNCITHERLEELMTAAEKRHKGDSATEAGIAAAAAEAAAAKRLKGRKATQKL
mmetsp:Transcript_79355/g.143203  ORF Transcript_79355/g.143203 Transcript_79355/m.143203 type:complete len:464 (+) Transcript_79355:84-1475(+)